MLNLNLSGLNPSTVAWYEFFPANVDNEGNSYPGVKAAIKLITLNGALLTIEGDEAQALYDHFRVTGRDLLSQHKTYRQALDTLRAFYTDTLKDNNETGNLFSFADDYLSDVDKALSVLGA